MTNPAKSEPSRMPAEKTSPPSSAAAIEAPAPKTAESPTAEPPTPATTFPHAALPKIIAFQELARCGEEIWISHGGQLYRLQSTKSGKLILTK